MSLRREPGRVIFNLNTSDLQTAAIVLLGAVVGVVLFLAFKPFAPDLVGIGDSETTGDFVSWSAAPRFDVEVAGRPSLGTSDAPVTIVEFTDYGCPYCRRHALEVMPTLLDTFAISQFQP